MALTLSAQVFCCGANGVGQLGLNRIDEKGTVLHFALYKIFCVRSSSIYSVLVGWVSGCIYRVSSTTGNQNKTIFLIHKFN